MFKLKGRGACLLIFSILLPCVLFSAVAELTRNIQRIELPSSTVLAEEGSEPGGLFIAEGPLRSQPLSQNKTRLNKLWKYLLSLVVFASLLGAFSKAALEKNRLHNYVPRKFFRILVISLLLGGRAPPYPLFRESREFVAPVK
ncbi:MAG: hypothetical protein LBU19_11510 [Treponema sp.]|nr:hypothetical protein [Treponema sp.]